MNRKQGFTLIELLLVMVIMGILALIGVQTFYTSLQKGRDSTRKASLRSISAALELYFNDKGQYPVWDGSGSIPGCYTTDFVSTGSCGASYPVFKDSLAKGAIYMMKFPTDPISGQKYYYVSNGTQYQIYVHLENTQDPMIIAPAASGTDCGTGSPCNYGVSSANTAP